MSGELHLGKHGTFLHRFSIARWSWAVTLCLFSDDGDGGYYVLHLFCLWIRLWRTNSSPVGDMLDRWGIELHERSILMSWGGHYKFIYLPWMYDYCRTEVMLRDGTFVPYERWTRSGESPEPLDIFREVHPYTYVLRAVYSHDTENDHKYVQRRKATITVERRSWCWRGWPFRWLRWPRSVQTTIDVQFDDEVGEQSGSWKGGTIGCGYELRKNETPVECLRRMERERKFT